MKQLHTEIIIKASVQHIWDVLTDFDAYPEWNPFITSLEGDVNEGSQFTVVLQSPNSKPMTFKPTCLKLQPYKEFRWLGRLIFPGLFNGEHIFELIDNGNGKVRFVQREKFKGLLVPLLWKQLNTKTRQGFEHMNAKLKERAEQRS
jgi:hypothetical protein